MGSSLIRHCSIKPFAKQPLGLVRRIAKAMELLLERLITGSLRMLQDGCHTSRNRGGEGDELELVPTMPSCFV